MAKISKGKEHKDLIWRCPACTNSPVVCMHGVHVFRSQFLTTKLDCRNRGLGRKMGDGVQFTITALGGLAFGFWCSWKLSLLILTVVPLMAGITGVVIKLNQTKTARASSEEIYSSFRLSLHLCHPLLSLLSF